MKYIRLISISGALALASCSDEASADILKKGQHLEELRDSKKFEYFDYTSFAVEMRHLREIYELREAIKNLKTKELVGDEKQKEANFHNKMMGYLKKELEALRKLKKSSQAGDDLFVVSRLPKGNEGYLLFRDGKLIDFVFLEL